MLTRNIVTRGLSSGRRAAVPAEWLRADKHRLSDARTFSSHIGDKFKVGDEASARIMVSDKDTATFMKSGNLPVFATPALVALCEEAACNAVKAGLAAGETTVGTKMQISHEKASVVNATITAFARIDEIDHKRITFSVWAKDESGVIGSGTHERFRVDGDKLVEKAKQRLFGPRSCPGN